MGLLDELSGYMVKRSIENTDPKKPPSVPLSSQVLSALQGASNAAATNLSAPVDGIAWLLRKAGVPIPANHVGGSDWMAQQGLTREPQNRNAGLLGEAIGGVAPMLVAAKAPQIAKGLLQVEANAMAPTKLSKEAGVIGYHGTMTPNFEKFSLDKFGKTDEGWLGKGVYASESPLDASAYATINNQPGGAVLKVDMDLKNPVMIDWEAKNRAELLAKRRELGPSGFTDWLKSLGHDGVIFKGPKSAVNSMGQRDVQYMAFDPELAKIVNY